MNYGVATVTVVFDAQGLPFRITPIRGGGKLVSIIPTILCTTVVSWETTVVHRIVGMIETRGKLASSHQLNLTEKDPP
jgi:hypothetical protein